MCMKATAGVVKPVNKAKKLIKIDAQCKSVGWKWWVTLTVLAVENIKWIRLATVEQYKKIIAAV